MAEIALEIEYDGGPFAGWQRQAGPVTVQGTLEAALGAVDPEAAVIGAAGRTDSGVHASGQVVLCRLRKPLAPARLAAALNAHLRPAPLAVLRAAMPPAGFHPRFSAVERRYVYRILNRRAPAVLERGHVWQLGRALDAGAMRAGAAHLIGRHDFTTFRAAGCQADSPLRTLDAITIEAIAVPGGQELRLAFRARSYLHRQVRSIVGTLERVGAGAWKPGDVARALAARERAACGPVAPAAGLCLTGVCYARDPFEGG